MNIQLKAALCTAGLLGAIGIIACSFIFAGQVILPVIIVGGFAYAVYLIYLAFLSSFELEEKLKVMGEKYEVK